VIDLGIHLVDLGLWTLGQPAVNHVTSRLYTSGKPLDRDANTVEDYATARLDLEDGATIQLACSWKLAAGCDAVIGATFYGTEGGVRFHNVDGSFYDFTAERFRGTKRELLCEPPDAWGGRAIVEWVKRLAGGSGYDPEIETVCQVSEALDAIYQQ
jgi:predicted dehydrogenase